MLKTSILKAVPLTVGLLFISACATTSTAPAATASASEATVVKPLDTVAEATTMKETADKLTMTKSVAKSDDGRMVCKRIAKPGTKFKTKVCAPAADWAARADEDKQTVGNIQRTGGAPGTGN